jgi:ketosteroid isomerase-like protein
MKELAVLSVFLLLPVHSLSAQAPPPDPVLTQQVAAAESTFAAVFARRDVAAFAAFVAPDAVFIGRAGTMRGKEAVVEGWRELIESAEPPFSWSPQLVEVLPSGGLALSTGPVLNPAGQQVGTFSSIWRREQDGTWRIIFDKGCPVCEDTSAP